MRIFLVCGLMILTTGIAQAQGDLCTIAASSIEAASRIRTLSIKHSVPCLVQDKEEVKKYLLNTIDTKLPSGRLEMEEYTFKTLGLIPENFDYKNGIVDLYVSQIGGYYDPEKNHYVMAAWMPEVLQTTIAVHELTHALQDQYYNLDEMMDPKLDNSDVLLARSALVEGDATAVMLDYQRQLMGQPSLSKEADVNAIMFQNVVGASLMSGAGGVPQSLQLMLLFPYTSGLRFVHHHLRKDGFRGLDRLFKSPPTSTEQILHPEKEAKYKTFTDADFESDLIAGSEVLHRDTMGEFGISALLGASMSDKGKVANAAAGWGGDRLLVIKQAGAKSLVWRTNWDSQKDAEEFYTAYSMALKQRYPELTAQGTSVVGRTGTGRLISFVRQDQGTLLKISG